jgi:hypothetical protein
MKGLVRTFLVLGLAVPLWAEPIAGDSLERYARTIRAVISESSAQRPVVAPDACAAIGRFTDGTITCGQTIQGVLGGTGDCLSNDGYYLDLWEAPVTYGQVVTFTFNGSHPNEDAFIVILRDVGSIVEISRAIGLGTLRTSFTAAATDTYIIGVGYADENIGGTYSLLMTCAGTPPPPGACIPDAATSCLLDNRFEVRVRYRGVFDNNAVDTQAQVKSVIGFADPSYETAFFYFNSSNNIEMMVKILDQGNVDAQNHPTIAVLYGTATPLRVEVTIRDTKSGGATRTWTTEFGKMQGTTDFTAFLK